MPPLVGEQAVGWARAVARVAHTGQVDKAGEPYEGHLRRVASAVENYGWRYMVVAWLHDILEDTIMTPRRLLAGGFCTELVDAVDLLTRYPWVSNDTYYERIRANPIALAVKLADIADNSDETRLAKLDEPTAARLRRKYAKATDKLLGGVLPLSHFMQFTDGED